MIRDRKFIAALFLGSMLPAAVYVLFNWLDYVNLRAALAMPGGGACPVGDTACAQEILGEHWASFLISVMLGFPFIYFANLAVAIAVLVIIDHLRFRVRINSAEI